MTMMNTKKYKAKLEEEKTLLEEELASIGKFDKKTDDWEAVPEDQTSPESDENDLADRSEDYGERTGILNTLEIRLNDIKKALGEIESGKYGRCDKCGKEIEDDRLDANPAAHTWKACML
jgi:DnaK suppressor protein